MPARSASTENRRPSGRNAVHSASSPSIQSPPFSSNVTRPCRLSTQMRASTCISRVRQPISSRKYTIPTSTNANATSSGCDRMKKNENIHCVGGRHNIMWFGTSP